MSSAGSASLAPPAQGAPGPECRRPAVDMSGSKLAMKDVAAGGGSAPACVYSSSSLLDDDVGLSNILAFSWDDIAAPIADIKPSLRETGSNFAMEDAAGAEQEESGVLCIPGDNLAELDWLASIGTEPFMGLPAPAASILCPRQPLSPGAFLKDDSGERSPVSVLERSFSSSQLSAGGQDNGSSALPGRPRSKRSRGMARVWSTELLAGLDDGVSEKKMRRYRAAKGPDGVRRVPSIASFSSLSGLEDGSGVVPDAYGAADSYLPQVDTGKGSAQRSPSKASAKRVRKSPPSSGADWTVHRRCSHCASTKTPQWRAGPNGPKTLCNACGVRFKSGRLLPEYRPAGSPGYLGDKHSNSHRRILEMRRQREGQRAPGSPDNAKDDVEHELLQEACRSKEVGPLASAQEQQVARGAAPGVEPDMGHAVVPALGQVVMAY